MHVPLSDGWTTDVRLDWREEAIGRVVPRPGHLDQWGIPQISQRDRGGMLTPKIVRELWIGSFFWPNKWESLVGMCSNREWALPWVWDALWTMSEEVKLPHCIWLESGQHVWNDLLFNIQKKVVPVEKEMIEERVQQGVFKPAWGPCRNAHYIISKNNGNYCILTSGVSTTWHIVQDTKVLRNIEDLPEAFSRLPRSLLVDWHYGYDHMVLHKDSLDYMAFQTTDGMYQPTRQV